MTTDRHGRLHDPRNGRFVDMPSAGLPGLFSAGVRRGRFAGAEARRMQEVTSRPMTRQHLREAQHARVRAASAVRMAQEMETNARHQEIAARAPGRMSAPKPSARSAREVADAIEASKTRDEALSHLDGLTIAQMKDVAAEMKITLRGRSKEQIRTDLSSGPTFRAIFETSGNSAFSAGMGRASAPGAALPEAAPLHAARTRMTAPHAPQAPSKVEAAKADIRRAVAELQTRPDAWVGLADLRNHLGEKHNRHDVDQALRELQQQPDVNIVPESNQKMLTQADWDAALYFGNQYKHAITIGPHVSGDYPPAPVSTAPKKAAPTPAEYNASLDASTQARMREMMQQHREASRPAAPVKKAAARSRMTAPKASARTPREVADAIRGAQTQEEGHAILQGLTIAQMKEVGTELGMTAYRGRTKDQIRHDIVFGQIGLPAQFRAIGEQNLFKPGGVSEVVRTVEQRAAAAPAKKAATRARMTAPKRTTQEHVDALRAMTSREEARAYVRDIKGADLAALTKRSNGPSRATVDEKRRHIVQNYVGHRLDSDAIMRVKLP